MIQCIPLSRCNPTRNLHPGRLTNGGLPSAGFSFVTQALPTTIIRLRCSSPRVVMNSKHIPMTMEAFRNLIRDPAWKYEYYGDTAHITPSHQIVMVSRPVETHDSDPGPYDIIALCDAVEAELINLFIKAFSGTIDFCDCDDTLISTYANRTISHCIHHVPPNFSCASMLACHGAVPVGGLLVTLTSDSYPMIEAVFTDPDYRREGIATCLLYRSMGALARRGQKQIISSYNLGSQASASWHQAVRFKNLPDLVLAQRMLYFARNELARRERLDDLADAERGHLVNEIRNRELEVTNLERIKNEEGFDAVAPVLRYLTKKTNHG